MFTPALGLGKYPPSRQLSGSAWHNVQQLASTDIDDARRPSLVSEPSAPCHQHLIETQRRHAAGALRVSIKQRLAPTLHRGVHHMPTTTQLRRELFERATPPRLTRHPTTGARSQPLPTWRDLRVLLGDRARRALPRWAAPPAFMPHQNRRSAEHRQIHQLHGPVTIREQRLTAVPAQWSRRSPPHMHPQRLGGGVDAEHLHITESHQQFIDACRVTLHRDPPVIRVRNNADSGGSLAFNRGCSPPPLRPQTRRAPLLQS